MEGDKDEEPGMVTSTNTTVDPGAVVVIALDAPLAYVAVITSWQSHDFTFEAQLVYGEPLEQLSLSDTLLVPDIARASAPRQKG